MLVCYIINVNKPLSYAINKVLLINKQQSTMIIKLRPFISVLKRYFLVFYQ